MYKLHFNLSDGSVLLTDNDIVEIGKSEVLTTNDESVEIVENDSKEYISILQKNNELLISIDETLKYSANLSYYALILIIFYFIVKFFYKLFSWFI